MENEKRVLKSFKMKDSVYQKALSNARKVLGSNLNAEVEKRVTEIANSKKKK